MWSKQAPFQAAQRPQPHHAITAACARRRCRCAHVCNGTRLGRGALVLLLAWCVQLVAADQALQSTYGSICRQDAARVVGMRE